MQEKSHDLGNMFRDMLGNGEGLLYCCGKTSVGFAADQKRGHGCAPSAIDTRRADMHHKREAGNVGRSCL